MMIQFHATLAEMVDFVNSVDSEFKVNKILMVLKPFALEVIKNPITINDIELVGEARIIFSRVSPNCTALSPNGFYDLNPGTVDLDIGRLTDKGLNESSLSIFSGNKDEVALAKKIGSRLKKITKAGVIAVSPVDGSEVKVRSHRYTLGAKLLHDQGIKILPVAGDCFLKLHG